MSAHDESQASRRVDAALAADLPEVLTGHGVVLRRGAPSDIETIVELARDADVRETIWLPVGYRCSRRRAEEFISELNDGWAGRGRFGPSYVLSESFDGEMRGIVFLRAHRPAVVEVAYGVAPAHRNRGLARRALGAVTSWATTTGYTMDLHIARSHTASIRVAHAAGFTLIGPKLDSAYDDLIYRRSYGPPRAATR